MSINRTQKDLNAMLQRAIDEAAEAGLTIGDIDETIYFTRATKTYGKCERIEGGFAIHISKYFKDNDEQEVMEMLVHEVLHTVPGCFNHGAGWKNAAELVNKKYGYNISRLSNVEMNGIAASEKVVVYKYVVHCADCDNKMYRQRKSKLVTHPQNYTCGACGGPLLSSEID